MAYDAVKSKRPGCMHAHTQREREWGLELVTPIISEKGGTKCLKSNKDPRRYAGEETSEHTKKNAEKSNLLDDTTLNTTQTTR